MNKKAVPLSSFQEQCSFQPKIEFYQIQYIVYKQYRMKRKTDYKTINTFTRAPSTAQICSYLIIGLETATFYSIVQPNLISTVSSTVVLTLFSASLLILCITTFICSYIDPSDPLLRKQKSSVSTQQYPEPLPDPFPQPESNPYSYEIQLYCNDCSSSVTKNAKHCRQCDRCVESFDHHCMWINNCIGGKNYMAFIVMITSVCVNLGVYLAAVICLTIENMWQGFLGQAILCWIVMAIAFVLWFLVLNLNILHIYLMCKGITTYQFLVIRREEERLKKLEVNRKNHRRNNAKVEPIHAVQVIQKPAIEVSHPQEIQETQVEHSAEQEEQEDQEDQATTVKIHEKKLRKEKKKIGDKKGSVEGTDSDGNPSESKTSNIFNGPFGKSQDSSHQLHSELNNFIKPEVIFVKENKAVSEVESEPARISQFFVKNMSLSFLIYSDEPINPDAKPSNQSAIICDWGESPQNRKISENFCEKTRRKMSFKQRKLQKARNIV